MNKVLIDEDWVYTDRVYACKGCNRIVAFARYEDDADQTVGDRMPYLMKIDKCTVPHMEKCVKNYSRSSHDIYKHYKLIISSQ